MSALHLFFGFDGRINRTLYWVATLILTLLMAGLAAVIEFIGEAGNLTHYIALAGVFLLISYSGLAVGAKRFHDRDKSAWLLLYLFGSAIILIPAEIMQNDLLIAAGSVFSYAISAWFFVELGFLRGTVGPNRFGPDPTSAT